MKTVLTIAGSDCSGGAGIQADIKTITAHRHYAMSVITSLTAQNTTGVYGVLDTDPQFVGAQLDCVFSDIRPDAVKIGMVSNAEIIEVVADKLVEYGAQNIVLDPVMISTSGSRLLDRDAGQALVEKLLPMARLVTPNLAEAACLSGIEPRTRDEMCRAARGIAARTPAAVLVKGGHAVGEADDLLLDADGGLHWFSAARLDNPNTHGTGCTLSSAIACRLAEGCGLPEAVRLAKDYITGAIASGLQLGRGSGPVNHCYAL